MNPRYEVAGFGPTLQACEERILEYLAESEREVTMEDRVQRAARCLNTVLQGRGLPMLGDRSLDQLGPLETQAIEAEASHLMQAEDLENASTSSQNEK